jgi:hypothetical protein
VQDFLIVGFLICWISHLLGSIVTAVLTGLSNFLIEDEKERKVAKKGKLWKKAGVLAVSTLLGLLYNETLAALLPAAAANLRTRKEGKLSPQLLK